MKNARLIVTCAVVSCVAAFSTSASAAILLYSQDFQSFAAGTTNPDGWDGASRAFSGGGASTEGGTNDRALIATSLGSFTTRRDLGVAVLPNATYTLDLDGGLYASGVGATSELRWELGTINAGVFTSFSTFNSTTLTNSVVSERFFGAGNEVALAQYSFTTGGTVSGDNLAISLRVQETSGFGGFDSISVNLLTAPEPSTLLLTVLSLVGLACTRRRCNRRS